MIEILKERYYLDCIEIRRDLHKIPEEGLKEFKTNKYIMNYLNKIGLKCEKSAGTGVICFFDVGSDETYAFRADMDGLSIAEENNIDFKSEHNGMMHACGHDGHMTILLLFAKYLVENKDKIKKNILLIFQPAEEGPGGARIMVEEGVLRRFHVKNVFGLHIEPYIQKGKIATKPGNFFASTTEFTINIEGKSAHGAKPEDGIDAIVIASEFIMAVQTIISRGIAPTKESLITIGTIKGGDRLNVIPRFVTFDGTIRAMEESIKNRIYEKMTNLAQGFEKAYDCHINIDFRPCYPALQNDKRLYEQIKPAFKDRFIEADITMGAEDFSFFSKTVPSLYFQVGVQDDEKGYNAPAHSSRFNFDEEDLLVGLEADINVAKIMGALE